MMPKKQLLLCLMILTFLINCSHVREYSSYDEINKSAFGHEVDLILIWGNQLNGASLYIGPDSTRWHDAELGRNRSVPTANVARIEIIKHDLGSVHGFQTGFLGGIGFAAGLVLTKVAPVFSNLDAGKILQVGLTTGLISGMIIGTPVGTLIGSRDIYIISKDSSAMEPLKTNEEKNDQR